VKRSEMKTNAKKTAQREALFDAVALLTMGAVVFMVLF
tara:strand:+ start:1415 stop:1528 length:114 start_codon:yes stop_codon:yes gene_type:complete